MRSCPACRSSEVFASHRQSLLERGPLTWLAVLPFRCGDCQARFYRLALHDPRRRGQDPLFPSDRPRPARWALALETSVTVRRPGGPPCRLSGTLENASLDGARVRLPEALPEGSHIEVSLGGGAVASGRVRWSRPDGREGVLHGLRLDVPAKAHSPHARPLRRLRRRWALRRLAIGAAALIVIALAAWGLGRMMDAFRAYDPRYYEPKDIERQRYELQRQLEELSRPPAP